MLSNSPSRAAAHRHEVGQLLGHCDALEQRIAESRRLAGQLLQTALREALGGWDVAGLNPLSLTKP